MLVFAVAVLTGLVAGLLRPALGARCQRIRIGRLWLLAIGAAGATAASVVPEDVAPLTMGVALAVLLAFALSNAQVTGVVVIGLGLLLNLVAVVLNNGVPVRGGALVAAGIVERSDLATIDLGGLRHLETNADRLSVLGDVLPVRPARSVLSFGDLLVIAGVTDAVRDLARRRRRRWTGTDRTDYDSTMTQLRAVHDWGVAPSPSPDSATQYSENPDRTAPATIDLRSAPATSGTRPSMAATHNK